jgi:hypothetical protein
MMARRGALGLFASGLSALLVGCGLIGGTKSYRFRMTVEVESPAGLKSGSSVMEITSYKAVALTAQEHAGGGGLRGEAVVVDLPGGPIFVLLQNDGHGQPLGVRVTSALTPDAKFNSVDDYVATVGHLGGLFASAKAELPRKDWPLMVRFRDIQDPKSVESVNPEATGVKRIVVETTGDDVTVGVGKWLSWFDRYADRHFDGTSASSEDMTASDLSAHMTSRSFSTEIGR